uniref:PIN domain-containing protein n=1 Tax=Oryza meridionalis TaxID=40149 RepID=A0A0E0DG70_9ORYZ
MTTTAPLGVVPLLEGVVLALTSPGTKNLPRATAVVDSCIAFEALQLLRCRGATKLGNDDALQFLYKVVVASCV